MATTNDSVLKTKHVTDDPTIGGANGTKVGPVDEIATAKADPTEVNNYVAEQSVDLVVSGEESPGQILMLIRLNSTWLSENFKIFKDNLSTHLYYRINSLSVSLIPVNSLSETNGVIAVMTISDGSIVPVNADEQNQAIWQNSPNVSFLMCRQPNTIKFDNFSNPVMTSPWRFTRHDETSDPRLSSFGTVVIGSASKTDSLTAGKYTCRYTIGFTVKERIRFPTTTPAATTITEICSYEDMTKATTELHFNSDKRMLITTIPKDNTADYVGTLYLTPAINLYVVFSETDDEGNTIEEDIIIPINQAQIVVTQDSIVLSYPLGRKHLTLIDRPTLISANPSTKQGLRGYIVYEAVVRKYIPRAEPQPLENAIRALNDIDISRDQKQIIRRQFVKKLLK